jgi:hypothetical protein
MRSVFAGILLCLGRVTRKPPFREPEGGHSMNLLKSVQEPFQVSELLLSPAGP